MTISKESCTSAPVCTVRPALHSLLHICIIENHIECNNTQEVAEDKKKQFFPNQEVGLKYGESIKLNEIKIYPNSSKILELDWHIL